MLRLEEAVREALQVIKTTVLWLALSANIGATEEVASGPSENVGIVVDVVVLVDGAPETVLMLHGVGIELLFENSDGEVLLDGDLWMEDVLRPAAENATILIDRFPMRIRSETVAPVPEDGTLLSVTLIASSQSDESTESEQRRAPSGVNPRYWTSTGILFGDSPRFPVWYVIIEQHQYCLILRDQDDNCLPRPQRRPDRDPETTDEMEGAAAIGNEAGAINDETGQPQSESPANGAPSLPASEPVPEPVPEPITMPITVMLAFAATEESRFSSSVRRMSRSCSATLSFRGASSPVPLTFNSSLEDVPPTASGSYSTMLGNNLGLEDARISFARQPTAPGFCPFDGAVFSIGDLEHGPDGLSATITLPALEPQLTVIYDLSGQRIGDNDAESEAALLEFAVIVSETLRERLLVRSANYGWISDYFTWVPAGHTSPTLVLVSELDEDGEGEPQLGQELHILTQSVRQQMRIAIADSIGVRLPDISSLLTEAAGSFAPVLETGQSQGYGGDNLRVLVQVADTARNACLDAGVVQEQVAVDIRPNAARYIVAISEPALSFDPEYAEQTDDPYIWRCISEQDDDVLTYLVPLADVARDLAWEALNEQIGRLAPNLIP